MRIKKQCKKCKFNDLGKCLKKSYSYSDSKEIISDNRKSCDNWEPNEKFNNKIMNQAPWYLKEALKYDKIIYKDFLELVEKDGKGEAIKINIYDAIKKVYGYSIVNLALLMEVSFGVMYRARSTKTPVKRIKAVSELLCIPEEFFVEFTSLDLAKLEKCKVAFIAKAKTMKFPQEVPNWFTNLIGEICTLLGCAAPVAREIAQVDRLRWVEGEVLSVNRYEKAMFDYTNQKAAELNKEIASIKYSLDIGGHPHFTASFEDKK